MSLPHKRTPVELSSSVANTLSFNWVYNISLILKILISSLLRGERGGEKSLLDSSSDRVFTVWMWFHRPNPQGRQETLRKFISLLRELRGCHKTHQARTPNGGYLAAPLLEQGQNFSDVNSISFPVKYSNTGEQEKIFWNMLLENNHSLRKQAEKTQNENICFLISSTTPE